MHTTSVIRGERDALSHVITADGCEVASDADRPSHVRLVLIMPDSVGVLHIHSPMTVNAIIAALVEHRERVWPGC